MCSNAPQRSTESSLPASSTKYGAPRHGVTLPTPRCNAPLMETPCWSEWSALYQRITTLTGKSSQRHLLAHAAIRQEVITKQRPISSSGFLGLMETAISYRVEQDAALLLAGQREARTA